MDWLDIRNNPNVKVVTEQNYRGFQMKHVKDKGWKIVLGDEEYLFPTFQDATFAADKVHSNLIKMQKGRSSVNIKDPRRDEYIYAERQKGRTYKDIGKDLGITASRVRGLYVRACRDRRQKYFKTHPEAYKEWHENPNDPKWDNLPEE